MDDRHEGLVANIQDFAVHDGSGLRSVAFLKGCRLRCGWCQNPECLSMVPEIVYRKALCIGCGRCVNECGSSEIAEVHSGKMPTKCSSCMRCVPVCPSGALKRIGHVMHVHDLVNTLLQYKPFYDGSDRGGVTLSGGDPLVQHGFTVRLLRELRGRGIHTAVETALYADTALVNELLRHVDLVLFDLKHMDSDRHRLGTGASNELILHNAEVVARSREQWGYDCAVRIPLVPGFNDDDENLQETGLFVASIGLRKVDILPFNDLASAKYREMSKTWKFEGVPQQSKAQLERQAALLRSLGLDVTVGGLW